MPRALMHALPVCAGLFGLISCRDHSSISEPEYADASLTAANTWATRKSMPTARAYLVAGVVNNLIYAVGGEKGVLASRAITKVEAYDATSNTWSTKAPLPNARKQANGATAINGILYIPGGIAYSGHPTRSLFAYNPATNSWSRKADMPVSSFGGTSVVIQGKLYVTAGSTDGGARASNLLHRYDPATDTWVELARSPHAHFHAAAGAIGGKLLLVGGYDNDPPDQVRLTAALDVYDPATNIWTTKAPIPTKRFGATARAINQKLYVVGGVAQSIITGALEVYDLASNTWTARRPMPTARTDAAAGVIGGRLYVIGGINNSGQRLGTVEAYTP
jgi:N-acetylneuraminic acid mutarotase